MRIALLQCELEHRHQAPHLAMCLYATDLRRDGHEVRCALVNPRGLDQAVGALQGRCDLLVLDSIFPFGLIRRLRAVGATTVVGGHNALQHALRGPADLAIVGAGRRPLRQLARALDAGDDPLSVAGVWRRDARGILDCGPEPPTLDLRRELLPFEPDLDWEAFGPPRAPGSNLRVPSIVAAVGCPWNRSVLGDAGPYGAVRARLPDVAMSPPARARVLRDFVEREGGCTFCVLRYTGPATAPRREALDLLLEQARALVDLGARGLSLQTEDPLPLLAPLLERFAATGLTDRLDELHVRSIPWLILRRRQELDAAIAAAETSGVRLVLAQVGFEAFDAPTLAAWHKGLRPEENLEAARILARLTDTHEAFVGTAGHGMVPLHPWTTADGLRRTIEACRRHAPFLLPGVHPAARVELYDEWSPLFWRIEDAGLLRPAPDRFGWDWDFADPDLGEAVEAAAELLRRAPAAAPHAGAGALEATLEVLQSAPDRAGRRRAWRRLLDREPAAIIGG